jgi:outer membrane protein assembly factor BamE (lipoprotein component of BamABCDE complex)
MKHIFTLLILSYATLTSFAQSDFSEFHIGMKEKAVRKVLKGVEVEEDIVTGDYGFFQAGSISFSFVSQRYGCGFSTFVYVYEGRVCSSFMICPDNFGDSEGGPTLKECLPAELEKRFVYDLSTSYGKPTLLEHGGTLLQHDRTFRKWDGDKFSVIITNFLGTFMVGFIAPISDEDLIEYLGAQEKERGRVDEKDRGHMDNVFEAANIKVGDTEEQVRALAGEPRMSMVIMDETVWTYGSWMVSFVDGKATSIDLADEPLRYNTASAQPAEMVEKDRSLISEGMTMEQVREKLEEPALEASLGDTTRWYYYDWSVDFIQSKVTHIETDEEIAARKALEQAKFDAINLLMESNVVKLGMTQEQVSEKLGEPTMSMEIMDEVVWTYGIWMITFEEGVVTDMYAAE